MCQKENDFMEINILDWSFINDFEASNFTQLSLVFHKLLCRKFLLVMMLIFERRRAKNCIKVRKKF